MVEAGQWVRLTDQERAIILDAVACWLSTSEASRDNFIALADKLAAPYNPPEITVGVYGGQVQWISGSPVPIRVCDYDGEQRDLPDRDEDGAPCRTWFEGTSVN